MTIYYHPMGEGEGGGKEQEIPTKLREAVTQFILRHYGTISEKELAERIAFYVYLNFCKESPSESSLKAEPVKEAQPSFLEWLDRKIKDQNDTKFGHYGAALEEVKRMYLSLHAQPDEAWFEERRKEIVQKIRSQPEPSLKAETEDKFSRTDLKKILMDFSYDIQQGKFGGASTHHHIVSLFMKEHPEWFGKKHPSMASSSLPGEQVEGKGEPDGQTLVICPACGGDGKETCNNPDHGFIEAIPGEIGRLGCPGCGYDPNHKVNRGKNVCPLCGGHGHVIYDVFEDFAKETGYDEEFALYTPPPLVEADRSTNNNDQDIPSGLREWMSSKMLAGSEEMKGAKAMYRQLAFGIPDYKGVPATREALEHRLKMMAVSVSNLQEKYLAERAANATLRESGQSSSSQHKEIEQDLRLQITDLIRQVSENSEEAEIYQDALKEIASGKVLPQFIAQQALNKFTNNTKDNAI